MQPLLTATLVVAALTIVSLPCSVSSADNPRFPIPASIPRPPDNWPGWKKLWRDDRYNYFLSYIQFHLLPNFTKVGFEVVDTPKHIHELLSESLSRYNDSTPLSDRPSNIVEGTEGAGFIPQEDLNQYIVHEMRPLHEAWSSLELEESWAFGLRVYRKGNFLKRHVDRVSTHVISSIVHVGRDVDWPIHIIDNDGVEHPMSLKPGQMMFYESARLAHARPALFTGMYYASLFVHYKPKGWPYTDAMLQNYLPYDWAHDTWETKESIPAHLSVKDNSGEETVLPSPAQQLNMATHASTAEAAKQEL